MGYLKLTCQHSYKWTSQNVHQLFADIIRFKDKSAYRLGTIVLHKEDGKHQIVDGQQRSLTLLLTLKALIKGY